MMICCIRDTEEKQDKKKEKDTKLLKCNCSINSMILEDDLFSTEILSCDEKYLSLNSKGAIELFEKGDIKEVKDSMKMYFSKVKIHLISLFLPKNKQFFLQSISSPSYDIIYNLQGTLKGSFILQDIYLYEGKGREKEREKGKKVDSQEIIKFQRKSPKDIYLLSKEDMEITFSTITFIDVCGKEKEYLSI